MCKSNAQSPHAWLYSMLHHRAGQYAAEGESVCCSSSRRLIVQEAGGFTSPVLINQVPHHLMGLVKLSEILLQAKGKDVRIDFCLEQDMWTCIKLHCEKTMVSETTVISGLPNSLLRDLPKTDRFHGSIPFTAVSDRQITTSLVELSSRTKSTRKFRRLCQ